MNSVNLLRVPVKAEKVDYITDVLNLEHVHSFALSHSACAKCDIHILKSDLNMEMLSWLYLLDGRPLEQMLRS